MEQPWRFIAICVVFYFATYVPPLKAEIFTSMADMEEMIISEKNMLKELKTYLNSEEKKLSNIREFLTRLDGTFKHLNESEVGKYLGNPVNSYLMLKRFNVDWKKLEKTLEADLAAGMRTDDAFNLNKDPFFKICSRECAKF